MTIDFNTDSNSIIGGRYPIIRLRLDKPTTVATTFVITSDNPKIVPNKSLTISKGATDAVTTLIVYKVAVDTHVRLTVTSLNTVVGTKDIIVVTPNSDLIPKITELVLPTEIKTWTKVKATIKFNRPVTQNTTVTLTSNNSNVVVTGQITIFSGEQEKEFDIQGNNIGTNGTVTITAKQNPSFVVTKAMKTVFVTPPLPSVQNVQVNTTNNEIASGSFFMCMITLTSPAYNTQINLRFDPTAFNVNPSTLFLAPSTIKFVNGSTQALFLMRSLGPKGSFTLGAGDINTMVTVV